GHGHHHSPDLPPTRRPGGRAGLLPRHARLRGPQRRRLPGNALDHRRPRRPTRHLDRPVPARCRPRHHRGRAPHHRRDDGQGHVRQHQSRHPRPRRHLRAAAGHRRRGRAGAHGAAVRHPRLRIPRPFRQHGPNPGAVM
ncbi:MAG: putative lyase, partial [uncultured Thermomicrobiales bacterium]